MNLFKTSSLILALSLLTTVSVYATEMDQMDTAETNHVLTEEQESEIDARVEEALRRKVAFLKNNQYGLDTDVSSAGMDSEDSAPVDDESHMEDVDSAPVYDESHMEDVDSNHAKHMEDVDSNHAKHMEDVDSNHAEHMEDSSASKKLEDEIDNLLKQIAESQNNSSVKSDSDDATA